MVVRRRLVGMGRSNSRVSHGKSDKSYCGCGQSVMLLPSLFRSCFRPFLTDRGGLVVVLVVVHDDSEYVPNID